MNVVSVFVCILATLAAAGPAPVRWGPADVPPARVARLAGLCRAWGAAKYFHPALAARPDIDWDAALVEAIPKVSAARTVAEYAAAGYVLLLLKPYDQNSARPSWRYAPSPSSN